MIPTLEEHKAICRLIEGAPSAAQEPSVQKILRQLETKGFAERKDGVWSSTELGKKFWKIPVEDWR